MAAAGAQSADEWFDVVDAQDRVIGQERRGVVHARGLRHRAVHVLVFNARGEVFLQKRSMLKDTFPGAWDSSAAGHLDAGEDYDAAALRELEEELGLATAGLAPERILRIEACSDTGEEFVWVYRLAHEGPFELHPQEIERGEWFAPDVVGAWIRREPEAFASGFVRIWRELYGA